MKKRNIAAATVAGAVGVGIIVAVSNSGSDATPPSSHSTSSSASSPAKAKGSVADQFKSWVKAHGLPGERSAVKHITKIQYQHNSVMSTADVYTNLSSAGMENYDTGKLIASAWADWKSTKNGAGLVTVYGPDGGLISNGNY